MKTYIYQSGIDLLSAQETSGSGVTSLVVTGFKAGDTADFAFSPNVNVLSGGVVFEGDENDVFFIPITDDEVMLQCVIPKTAEYMTIGAIQLMVNDQPFCVSIAPNALIKLEQAAGYTVGTRYVFQLMINIPQLMARFSFGNLNVNASTFKEFTNELQMTRWAWEEAYDQLVVGVHSQTGAPVVVLNAWNNYYGCPLLVRNTDDAKFWRIDGGVSGDRHLYTE